MRLNQDLQGHSLRDLYRIAGLSEQAVYKYNKRVLKDSIAITILLDSINAYRRKHPGCGLEKMYYQLHVRLMGRDQFIALCKALGYSVRRPRSNVKTTIPGCYRWPNLIEGLLVVDVNRVWQSDINYYLVGNKYRYLTFIIDVYSRKIVGYAVSTTLEAKANIKALSSAFRRRGKINHGQLIHHSDRGSQYTSKAYLALLHKHGTLPSMGVKGPDNAYAERINGTIKNEYLRYRNITNDKELQRWVKQAVTHYNTERIHDSLPRKQSPEAFEKELVTLNYQKRHCGCIYAR